MPDPARLLPSPQYGVPDTQYEVIEMMTNSRDTASSRREIQALETRIVDALMNRDEQEVERVVRHALHLYPNRKWSALTERKW